MAEMEFTRTRHRTIGDGHSESFRASPPNLGDRPGPILWDNGTAWVTWYPAASTPDPLIDVDREDL